MSERKGYYVKPAARVTIPGVVFSVRAYTFNDRDETASGLQERAWHSARVSVCYRRRGKWTAAQTAIVTTPDALREWMEVRAIAGRTNWVISDSALETLTLSEWWNYAERIGIYWGRKPRGNARRVESDDLPGRVRIEQHALSARCEILTYTLAGTRWRWVGACNYWPDHDAPVRDFGRDGSGDSAVDPHDLGAGRGVAEGPRCALLARFLALCDWWGRVARAPLGCTAGQLAWGVLRSHIPPRSLCAHTDPDAHRIERACAHGGRASVWFVGGVEANPDGKNGGVLRRDSGVYPSAVGPVTHVDVSGMYPHLLRSEPYPVKLRYFEGALPVPVLLATCRNWGVIARVRVRTERAEYPYRTERGTVYPVGEFTTTLAGPDLVALAGHGEIVRCFVALVYDMGRPFAGAMGALIDSRAEFTAAGDDASATFAKLVSNSLAGKLAQRAGRWERAPKLDHPGRWGEGYEINYQTGKTVRVRYLAGAAHQWIEEKEPRGPHTAAFAYLTAYGRQHMARIRALLPERSVVSQDTDGLYLLPSAVAKLTSEGMLAREGSGRLRVTASADSGRWWGPRHYRFGTEWTLSGFRKAEVLPGGDRIRHSSRTPLFATRLTGAPSRVLVRETESAFPLDIERGNVGPDGWVRPVRIVPRRIKGEE